MKKGDVIELDGVTVVKVAWCNETLMEVEYNDLTRRLLKKDAYNIKILSEETRKDFEKKCVANIGKCTKASLPNNIDCEGCYFWQ